MPEWLSSGSVGLLAAIIIPLSTLLGALGGLLVNRSQAKKNKIDMETAREAATTEAFRVREEAKNDAKQAINAAIEATTKLVDSQQKRIDQLHREVVEAEKRAELMAEKVHSASTRIEAAECALREVQDNLKRAKETITILEHDLVTARKENEILRMHLQELQEMQKASEGERERLQCEVDELSERLAKYESRPARSTKAAGK